MRFNDVLTNEREKRKISVQAAAEALGLSADDYLKFEADEEQFAEEWATVLVNIAIELEVPTSRLLSVTGKRKDLKVGKCGEQIKYQREHSKKSKTISDITKRLGMSEGDYDEIEKCNSAIEHYGPLFLAFADLTEIPVINILCPAAVPYRIDKKREALTTA